MQLRRTAAILLTVVVCIAGSALAQSGKSKKTVASGLWGGPHLRMEVTASGAELEFDCGTASISEPLTLDADNHFRASGSYKVGDFGPTREDARAQDAVFTGALDGDTLKMEMAVAGREQPQKFTLTRGREPKLFKCK
jgi:hypothetical protein